MRRLKRIASTFLAILLILTFFNTLGIKSQAASVSGKEIADYSKKFEGYPYKMGTKGPNTFDCSGLVTYVYNHFGISLPHGTSYFAGDGYKKYGEKITSIDSMRAGDLVFFGSNSSNLSHVGIYLGNGVMINALNPNKGVKICCVNEASYYKYRPSYQSWYVGDPFQYGVRIFGVDGTGYTASFPLQHEGVYRIKNVNSGKVIDVPNGSTDNSVQVVQHDSNGNKWQLWKAIRHEDGYSFINVHTGKALDIANSSTAEGEKVSQYTYNASAAQRYKLVDKGSGKYAIMPICSGWALDVYGWSKDNGVGIFQYAFHGGDNQLWTFESVDIKAPTFEGTSVYDVTNTGYTAECKISDNIGVTKVEFHTWTEANGKDDLVKNTQSTSANGFYACKINIADHGNAGGVYCTKVYAWDAAGNMSESQNLTVNIAKEIPLTSIELSNSSVTLSMGQSHLLYVTSYTPENTTSSKAATWISSNPDIVSVDQSGNIKALKSGSAIISCTVAEKTAYCDVTVMSDGIFVDVPSDAWYKGAVKYVKDNGIMNGTSDTTFEPGKMLTRAEFVTVLHNMEDKPSAEYISKFTDVSSDIWYTEPVMWALENDITSGISENTFGSDLDITREQLATMLFKYAMMKGASYKMTIDARILENYPDKMSVSTWANEALKWAVTNGVMSGKATEVGNILDPKGKATRAECAQMIMNLQEKATK